MHPPVQGPAGGKGGGGDRGAATRRGSGVRKSGQPSLGSPPPPGAPPKVSPYLANGGSHNRCLQNGYAVKLLLVQVQGALECGKWSSLKGGHSAKFEMNP